MTRGVGELTQQRRISLCWIKYPPFQLVVVWLSQDNFGLFTDMYQ